MLNCFFVAIAAVVSGTLCFAVPSLSFIWLIPLFAGAYVGAVLLFFLTLFVVSLFMPMRETPKKTSAFCRFLVRVSMAWLMPLLNVHITLEGTERIPAEPCVIVSNHRSGFDPLTVLAVLKSRKLIYISKESNFRIPLVGPFIHRAGFLAIDRGNGLRARRTLREASELQMREGLDVGVYPEGTRSKTGELLRFKLGAYMLAKDSEAPIVVMATEGTELVGKNAPFRRTNVRIRVVDVIDREMVKELTKEELRDRTQEMIARELGLKHD